MTHPYSIYVWQPPLSPHLEGHWNYPVHCATEQWALYIANLMNQDSHGVIKVVRYGLNIKCFPDAHAVELVEKQIARQKRRELEEPDRIIDSVGGQVLGTILGMLAPNGMCVNFGVFATSAVTFDLRSFFIAGGTSLHGFYLFQELQHESAQSGLTRLARMVEAQHLQPHIAFEESWEHLSEIAQQLMERRFAGKAVLTVTPGLN